MGDDEDDFDMRDVDVQDRDEVLAIWAQLIQDLRAVHRVCFYPGQHGAAPDFEDFVGALPLIGSCDALVYSEPRLTKIQAWERVGLHRANLQFPIPNLGFATGIDLVQTGDLLGVDRKGLFGQPPAMEWVSPEDGHLLASPSTPDDRFWGQYCRLTAGNRIVQVLQIGVGGNYAWDYFFRPHDIHPVRIIASPPWARGRRRPRR